MGSLAPGPCIHPDLARLGSHHEGREAVVVEHGLQVAVREEAGTLEQQQVVHLGDKLGVLPRVVRDGHQRVQHGVAPGVLPPHVRLLVGVLRQVVDDVGLVGAGSQRQGQLTCGPGWTGVSEGAPGLRLQVLVRQLDTAPSVGTCPVATAHFCG